MNLKKIIQFPQNLIQLSSRPDSHLSIPWKLYKVKKISASRPGEPELWKTSMTVLMKTNNIRNCLLKPVHLSFFRLKTKAKNSSISKQKSKIQRV